jgi:hypothetical protein
MAKLAAGGRGAIEEDRMPVFRNRMTPAQIGSPGSDTDEKDPRDEDRKRHYRVHHDAELAMIGVTPTRVHMRRLGDG